MRKLSILLALFLPSAALAQNQVALTSEVLVERRTTDANGAARVSLEAPGVVVPGDRVVFVLSYRNNGAAPAADFVVTNPIPEAVAFDGTESPGAVYSVDGGANWGELSALTIRGADGSNRPATLADVTGVRWRFIQAIPAGSGGQLRFRGIVR